MSHEKEVSFDSIDFMFEDIEDEDEHNGMIQDPETGEWGRCAEAHCRRCTRFQLDLCSGNFDEGEEEEDADEDDGDADFSAENDKQDMQEREG